MKTYYNKKKTLVNKMETKKQNKNVPKIGHIAAPQKWVLSWLGRTQKRCCIFPHLDMKQKVNIGSCYEAGEKPKNMSVFGSSFFLSLQIAKMPRFQPFILFEDSQGRQRPGKW